MSLLKQRIVEKIRSKGPISFETFMEMALYYPGLGYYAKESTTIGRAGDFYTSPHLHPIFGAMIARQVEEMWREMGLPDNFQIVEMGAGVGYLAKDLLGYLEGKEICGILNYTIVELNHHARACQKTLLHEHLDKIRWVTDLKELDHFSGCLISNELLDAFPVRLVEMEDELKEIYLAVREDALVEIRKPCSTEVRDYFIALDIHLPADFRTEVNLRIKDWLRAVSQCLSEGFVITVDYGYPAYIYYSEGRSRGTLYSYYRHQVNEDPYKHIGDQDITAHVNFSSVKMWGEELSLKTIGFCPQGTYFISLGIDEVIRELYGETPDPFDIAKIKGLILPQGMGESHKVLIQYKGEGEPRLRGFDLRNQKGRL